MLSKYFTSFLYRTQVIKGFNIQGKRMDWKLIAVRPVAAVNQFENRLRHSFIGKTEEYNGIKLQIVVAKPIVQRIGGSIIPFVGGCFQYIKNGNPCLLQQVRYFMLVVS
jgi:hypothetical protein